MHLNLSNVVEKHKEEQEEEDSVDFPNTLVHAQGRQSQLTSSSNRSKRTTAKFENYSNKVKPMVVSEVTPSQTTSSQKTLKTRKEYSYKIPKNQKDESRWVQLLALLSNDKKKSALANAEGFVNDWK